MVFLDWKELPWFWAGSDSFLWVALLVLVVPALIAFVFGYFAFRSRIKGVYFSIITQALTYAAMLLFFRNETGFGGNNGFTENSSASSAIRLPPRRRASFSLVSSALALIGTCCWRATWCTSKVGRILTAIRDAKSPVMFIGYNPLWYKLFVWTLSAMLCAIAGALYVPQVGIINPSKMSVCQFDRDRHLGCRRRARHAARPGHRGVHRQSGQELVTVSFPEYWLFFLGTLFIVATLYLPQGVVGLWFKLRAGFRERVASWRRPPEEPAHERRVLLMPKPQDEDDPDWDSGTAELGHILKPGRLDLSHKCHRSISRTSRSASTASGR